MQQTTILLHVAKNLILGGEGDTTLVQPVDELHVENIKTLMFAKPASFSAPFLLMVDLKDFPTKADWNPNPDVYTKWKYRVHGPETCINFGPVFAPGSFPNLGPFFNKLARGTA